MLLNYVHQATVLRVVDGDTLTARIDFGKYGTTKVEAEVALRLAHVDAPERTRPQAWQAAADFARELLPVGSQVLVATYKAERYGRTLATVQLPDGTDLGEQLVEAGHAVPYDGGAR